jgi:hypothetical protein
MAKTNFTNKMLPCELKLQEPKQMESPFALPLPLMNLFAFD